MSAARNSVATGVISSMLIAAGGAPTMDLTEVYELSGGGTSWTSAPSMPLAQKQHIGCIQGDGLFVPGGATATETVATLYVSPLAMHFLRDSEKT